MRKEEIKILKEKAENSTLWVLEMRIGRQNILLLEMVGQGVKSKEAKWRNIRDKRNIYRKVLLNKLKQWEIGKNEDSNPKYSDYINSQNHKREQEIEEWEKINK